MNKTTAILAAADLLLVAALAFLGGYATCRRFRPADIISTTDTVWRWHEDTAKLTSSKPAGTVIAVLPTAHHPDGGKTPQNGVLCADSARICQNAPADTLESGFLCDGHVTEPDSVAVEIPIEQRTYEGEYYRAVVRGWRPELVSIDVRHPEIHIPDQKRKRWAVTVGPQVGYGFTPAGWQPYAGVGVTVGLTF